MYDDLVAVAIEGLHHCPLLESLVLRCNYVDMLCNLDCCRNLWQLDLTGNRVSNDGYIDIGCHGNGVGEEFDRDWPVPGTRRSLLIVQ